MKYILSINLLLINIYCFSQEQITDSIWKAVYKTSSDTQRINLLNELTSVLSTYNNDSAFKVSQRAIQEAAKIKYIQGEATAQTNTGRIYFYKGNNTKALIHFLEAVKLLENNTSTYNITRKYRKQLSTSYNNIGIIYQRQKLYERAEDYFRKSISMDELAGDKIGLAHCYNNIGTIKEETGKYDDAIKNYEIALQLKVEANDTAGIPSTLINMGVIRMNQGKYTEAKNYFEKALETARGDYNKQDEALALIDLGDMYYLKSAYAESIPYYEKGIAVCKNQQYKDFLSYAYNSISLSFYKMKDFQKAYEYYQMHVSLKDTLYNNENAKIIHELEAKYDSDKKEKEIKLLISEGEIREMEMERKNIIMYIVIGGGIILIIIGVVVLRAYAQKRKANKELDEKNKKIELAYKIIEEKQKEIVDSINYAKRIQYTLLANNDFLKQNLHEHFVLFKPKDIVSGDFFWATKQENKFYLAVCDSTGHGVPGAFMSLLSIGFLSEAINEKGIQKPNEVFNYVRMRLIENISTEGQKDGFDGILVCFNHDDNTITYSAANNNPVLVKNNSLIHLPTDKMPVGIGEKQQEFNLYTIENKEDSTLYLYTDGYADQFGGPRGKKFKYKQLENLLLENSSKELNLQSEILNQKFDEWKGNLEQVDDVCVIGLRLY